MRDYYAPQDASRPTVYHTPYLTPYLGLRARLSQAFINRWTILLFLVLVRLLFAVASTDSSLTSAKREALSACTQVENIGSSMASMPHFMAQGVNEMTATGVEKAVSGLMKMLDMSVTAIEEIVLFVIHMMTSTYLCLITLAIRGSVGAAVELGTQLTSSLNQTIDEVTNGMGDATQSITDAINKVFDSVNGLPFVPGLEKPSIDLTDEINKLKSLEAPTDIQEGLQKLNASVPTFEEVQNFTDSVIRIPFEEVKKLIRAMDTFEFDRTVLPVPEKTKLDFCSEGNSINSFFNDLLDMASAAKKIALGVLITAALLAIIPMAWSEFRRYRTMKERSELFNNGHRPMDVVYLASRPHSSAWGLWIGQRFGSERRQTYARWAFAYATSMPMLFLLSIAIAGLFSCLCQYLIVRGIQNKVPELTNQVADFAEKVVTSLNNASMSWSGGVNGAVGKMDEKINGDILDWVNTTTSSVNDTLNAFVEKMSGTLNDTFGDGPLRDPIQDVLNCLIGLKIASFQKGLTWVQEHAHVSFPGVNNDTFSLGALAKLSDSSSAAELLADPNGKTRDEVTEAVTFVIEKILSGIRLEALIATVILLIWLAYALGGVIVACVLLSRKNNTTSGRDAYIVDPATTDGNQKAPGQDYPDPSPPYEYPLNKAAPYTIQRAPFPTFHHDNAPQSEKVGQVDAHPVAESARPGHLRASSHGHLADPSPSDEKRNPFLTAREEKNNPFRDV